ncbi:phosphatase PAP2 family protein [Pseudohoeflea coraliihabitans]|uniref:Phosphatase PAP2 family protein n=1 Tax=Pseudohoeflea coraliihabitans TaxID=2860393 RepID=A0ABS6WT30_9HYPH|nr:phosphatase PAP2 family protein [Pseudohoeflea sp. DP4N28-3]MBW3099116.1 phosphatase PAP2 family protein [Pseudohoeflea sp. DP4N28-3]
MSDAAQDGIQNRFYLALVGLWAVVLAAQRFSKVSVAYGDFAVALALSAALAIIGWVMRRRGYLLLSAVASLFAGLYLVLLPMIMANYMAMSFNRPLADDFLAALDAGLGFDWLAYIRFVDGLPWLADAFTLAYSSFTIQLLIVPLLLLLLFRDSRRAHAFIIAYALFTLIAAAIAIWFPAHGTYLYYGYDGSEFANLNTVFAFEFFDHFVAVRASDSFHIELGSVSGILTFPSVHAGVAYLAIWATWPYRLLRYPFFIVNLAMALATVSNANHYFIDALASIPLALITVLAVRRIMAMKSDRLSVPLAGPLVPAR